MDIAPKYSVGDRVMAVPFNEYFGEDEPAKATIMYIAKNGNGFAYAIEFDEFVGGHNCDNHCKWGHGFWQLEHTIISYELALPTPTTGDLSILGI